MSGKNETPVSVYVAALGFCLAFIVGMDYLFAHLYATHSWHWNFGVMLLLSAVNIAISAARYSRK